MGNEKIKIHELAKKLNTTGKRIVEKLQEINIEKSVQASLDQNELKALYEHIGFKPGSEKSSESVDVAADKKAAAKPKNAAKPTGIIMRRVVYNEDTSYSDAPSNDRQDSSKSGKRNGKPARAAASSGLRQGYAVRSSENYEDLMQSAKAEAAKRAEKTATAPSTGSGPVVKRVTRIKAKSDKSETVTEEKPAVTA